MAFPKLWKTKNLSFPRQCLCVFLCIHSLKKKKKAVHATVVTPCLLGKLGGSGVSGSRHLAGRCFQEAVLLREDRAECVLERGKVNSRSLFLLIPSPSGLRQWVLPWTLLLYRSFQACTWPYVTPHLGRPVPCPSLSPCSLDFLLSFFFFCGVGVEEETKGDKVIPHSLSIQQVRLWRVRACQCWGCLGLLRAGTYQYSIP